MNCVTDGLHLCAFTCDVCIWCNDMAAEGSADLYAITLDDHGGSHLHMLVNANYFYLILYGFFC
jgi:hypothetical protein